VHVFTTLLASNAPKVRTRGSTAASLALHAAMIGTAVWLTARQVSANPVPTDVHIAYLPQPAHAPPPAQSSTKALPVPPSPSTIPVISVPTLVPTALPPLDAVAIPVTDATIFSVGPSRAAVPGGSVAPVGGGDVAYDGSMVDKPVVPLSGQPPRYPAMLKDAGVEGRVDVRFVVDTLGRVERASVQVIDATHALFVESVRAALLRQRFSPAEVGGTRVRQLVTQPFLFTIQR
jgi:protein TonB